MAAPGYVLKNRRTTLERAEKFISHEYFTDYNLYGRLYTKEAPVKSISHYAAPGRITYEDAVSKEFKPTEVGQSFGPTWSTHWFRVEVETPAEWQGEEVALVWESGSEALVWKNGVPRQGLNSCFDRKEFDLGEYENTIQVLYIEMTCSSLFGAGKQLISPPSPDKTYTLTSCKLQVIDQAARKVFLDFNLLVSLIKALPENSNSGYQALYTANEMVNLCIEGRDNYEKAHTLATEFFAKKNGDTQHTIHAIGNCHIDSAWLWPYAETIRKCARSFSTTMRIMEKYPEFTFACSQAQQFEWVKERYPTLYEEMKKFAAQGRFIPVGGTWVEMDGNMPSGEGFIRQFLFGQRYFKKEFGAPCKEFWLPDTFGYSGQLPQVMKHMGIERFVTQKISWNLVNKFPHHTFWWHGIDGSAVLTHFPPGDSYCMKADPEELIKTIDNFQDKGRSNSSLYLYGYGDGGQGPTPEMLERLRRLQNVDGLPKVKFSTPDQYFEHVEEKEGGDLCHWNGELYLELHNGTYTTQAKLKKGNRKSEFLLRHVELLSSMVLLTGGSTGGYQYPTSDLTWMWKKVLLNQFHDVLPGSSIKEVNTDAEQYYKEVAEKGEELSLTAVLSLMKGGSGGSAQHVVMNSLSWTREEVISTTAFPGQVSQWDMHGKALVKVSVPSVGYSVVSKSAAHVPVQASKIADGQLLLRNDHLEATIDKAGRLVMLNKLGPNGFTRNALAEGSYGNQFVLFDDVPLYWDAWDVMDYHLETRKPVSKVIEAAEIVENGPLRATVKVKVAISDASYIEQLISVESGSPCVKFHTEVHWHENHKFLKVEFPAGVHSTQATYEIQFGHLQRATHFNTSWDWARFEVCGHKWADISEYDFGLSVMNDCKYGWSCLNNLLRLSLLRSPKAPDEDADMGVHTFTYAVMPHQGTFQSAGVIRAAYELNCPLESVPVTVSSDDPTTSSLLTIDNPAVVMETLKQAEDQADMFVIRLYEAFGGRASAQVKLNFPFSSVQRCNGLEVSLSEDETVLSRDGDVLRVNLQPFQVMSLLITQ